MFLTIAGTLLVMAIFLGIFLWFAYHTMHFDLPGMFISAVVAVLAFAIIFGVLGFVFPSFSF